MIRFEDMRPRDLGALIRVQHAPAIKWLRLKLRKYGGDVRAASADIGATEAAVFGWMRNCPELSQERQGRSGSIKRARARRSELVAGRKAGG